MDLLIYVQQTVERRICVWTKDGVAFQLLIMPGCSRRYVPVSSTESNEIMTQRYPINTVNVRQNLKNLATTLPTEIVSTNNYEQIKFRENLLQFLHNHLYYRFNSKTRKIKTRRSTILAAILCWVWDFTYQRKNIGWGSCRIGSEKIFEPNAGETKTRQATYV